MAIKANFRPVRKGSQVRRAIVFTRCIGDEVLEDGTTRPFEDVLLGVYTPKQATACIGRERADNLVRITRTTVYKQVCVMPLLDFWSASVAVTDPIITQEYVMDKKKEI